MEKICIKCSMPFSIPNAWVRKGGGRFCSNTCYNLYRSEHAQSHVERICEHCGKVFSVQVTRKEQKFCSISCKSAHVRITKTCTVCGKDFTVLQSQKYRYECCSKECRYASTVYIPCKRCGKIFRQSRTYMYSYCSEECRRPPVFLTCLNCSKQFRIVPALITRAHFCSVRCYRTFTGESEPEKNVRLCLTSLGIAFIQEYTIQGWTSPIDFFLTTLNTMLEVDGVYWHSLPGIAKRDARKTLFLQSKGYIVIRLPDTPFYGEVTDGMVDYIRTALNLTDNLISSSDVTSLYPIQLSLPFNQKG